MDLDRQAGTLRPLPLSQRLSQIVADDGPDRLTFSDLAARLQSSAWGGLLLIFAAINVLPLPPGTSTFFALPLILVSGQMLFGRASPWFPARLERRGVTKAELSRLIDKMEWLERRIERVLKPRIPALTGATAQRLIGLVCFLLGILAAIPIPLFHMAPALAILLFGLALVYSDGVVVIFAIAATMLSLVIDTLIVTSGVVALSYATAWLHR